MTKLSDLNLHDVGNTINLAGTLWAGQDKLYLCVFPGEDTSGLVLDRLDLSPDDWQAFLRQTDIMETEVLAKAKDGTLVKAILRKSQRNIDQGVSWKVFKRDGYACRYCGIDDAPLTVDHLVRWEEGGPSTEANLVSACRKCNKLRGNMAYADWLGSPRYRDASRKLSEAVRQANQAVLATLDGIPRRYHVHSR